MTQLSLTVNGRPAVAEVEPRTHLADFLRETLLLTGTHIGCEQGVCGACTVLVNGEPVRSCLTLAATCSGAEVQTIEALSDDAIGTALRAAFTAEHALQCGYCTPGMLVTARDIVRRLPDADEDRIRLELAGNLCRCTGYNGIVRAIRRVLDARIAAPSTPQTSAALPLLSPPMSPSMSHLAHAPSALKPDTANGPHAADIPAAAPHRPAHPQGSGQPDADAPAPRAPRPPGTGLHPVLRIAQPADRVWTAIQDPALVAACIPGARVTATFPDRIEGQMHASLGPIRAVFTGQAAITWDNASKTGHIQGDGRDKSGGTRLSAEASFAVTATGSATCELRLDIAYDLRGPLAQFSRGPVVEAFAAEIAAQVGRNLEARLRGETTLPTANGLAMTCKALWTMLRRWLTGRHD